MYNEKNINLKISERAGYDDTISCTVYNCPNTEKYRDNKIHIGRGEDEPDMYFIDSIFSVLGQLYTV
jgi:hypothetical protein